MLNIYKINIQFALFCVLMLISVPVCAGSIKTRWTTISVPGICTFEIPPSLEVQNGNYKRISEHVQEILDLDNSKNNIIVQPKGINAFNKSSLNKYCRIMFETIQGKEGDYKKLTDVHTVSTDELEHLNTELYGQLNSSLSASAYGRSEIKILSMQPAKIVHINGVEALHYSYTRSVNNGPPALVKMYMIQNNDCIHRITLSYRESQKDLWKQDLDDVVSTFKFQIR